MAALLLVGCGVVLPPEERADPRGTVLQDGGTVRDGASATATDATRPDAATGDVIAPGKDGEPGAGSTDGGRPLGCVLDRSSVDKCTL